MPYLFWVLIGGVTSHSLLILTVNISYFISSIDFSCLGNMNEDLNFEYGYGTAIEGGCGATLHNVFWYFGGFDKQRRQVRLQKHLMNNNLFHFSQVKLKDANWNVRSIWTLIFVVVHVTPSTNLINKFYFVSIRTIAENATREYFCSTFSYLIEFILKFRWTIL